MQELKLDDLIKVGYVAYHIAGGKIDDWMKIERAHGTVADIIDEGWSFISRTKKYKKGQKALIPISQQVQMRLPANEPPPLRPVIPIGVCLVNKNPKANTITCNSLKTAYEKLLSIMNKQDECNFIKGDLCVIVQIMKTPEQFKKSGVI
jgi:hypothetical protein